MKTQIRFLFLALVFVTLGGGLSSADAQTPAPTPAAKPQNPPVSPESMSLASELFRVLDLGKTINSGVDGVELLYKQVPASASPEMKKKREQANAAALAKYKSIKPKLLQDITEQVTKDLATQFSAAELKYLIEVYKYPAMKRIQTYLDAGISVAARKAFDQAQEFLNQEKKNFGVIDGSLAPVKR